MGKRAMGKKAMGKTPASSGSDMVDKHIQPDILQSNPVLQLNTSDIVRQLKEVHAKSMADSSNIESILNQLQTTQDGYLQDNLRELEEQRRASDKLIQEVRNYKEKLFSGGLTLTADSQGNLVIKNTRRSAVDVLYPSDDDDSYGEEGDDAQKRDEIMRLINNLMANLEQAKQMQVEKRW